MKDSDEIFGNEEVSPASSEESLDSKYEKSLSLIGFGPFQWFLSTLCVLANASDAIEILCISFVLPAAECDLDLSTTDKGYLSSITFAGLCTKTCSNHPFLILALERNDDWRICLGHSSRYIW